MTNNITTESTTGIIRMKVGEWKYITSEPFCMLFKNEKLLWSSLDTNIAQVNPNSGLLSACGVGTTTIFATDIDEATIKVFCSIEVTANESAVQAKTLNNRSTSVAIASCGGNGTNDSGNVSALGYSGTVFAYKVMGRQITLEKGFGAKNGTSNTYSDLFRYKLVEMNNIYAAMSVDQRRAWLKLRLHDFIGLVGLFNPQSVTETAMNIAKEILSGYGMDLEGRLEATILGIYNWYLAEEDAVSYYSAF